MHTLLVPSGLNLAETDTLIAAVRAVRAVREFTPAPCVRPKFST